MEALSPDNPSTRAPNRARSARVAVLSVVVLGALAALVVVRFQLTDPFRPGTSHRVVVALNGCDRPGGLWLEQRTWSSHDPLPPNWPNPSSSSGGSAQIPGTLDVTDTNEATFTADEGGAVHYHRLGPNALDDLSCPIK